MLRSGVNADTVPMSITSKRCGSMAGRVGDVVECAMMYSTRQTRNVTYFPPTGKTGPPATRPHVHVFYYTRYM